LEDGFTKKGQCHQEREKGDRPLDWEIKIKGGWSASKVIIVLGKADPVGDKLSKPKRGENHGDP